MKGYINLTHTNNGKIEQVKQELIDYINAHDGGEIQIVETLPTASAETYFNDSKTIYMVRNTSTSGDNYYDEYITIRTGEESSYTYSWEHIGSTQIDLSNYVQKTQTVAGVDLQDDITKSELQGALEDSTHRFVSDAEKGDWNGKQNALVSGENIKSINDESVLGAGNLQVGYPVLEGVGEPTSATAGKVNQLYRDTATNKVYICVAVTTESDVTSYEWQAVGGGMEVLSGTSKPTSSTVGEFGQMYIAENVSSNVRANSRTVWVCLGTTSQGQYRWSNVGGGTSNDGTYNVFIAGGAKYPKASQSVAIGYDAESWSSGLVIGYNTYANGGVALGYQARATGENSIAIGKGNGNSMVTASQSIQLLAGTNSTANTLQIKDDNIYNHSTHTLTVQNIELNGTDINTVIDNKIASAITTALNTAV